jgi:hypothetical protein
VVFGFIPMDRLACGSPENLPDSSVANPENYFARKIALLSVLE